MFNEKATMFLLHLFDFRVSFIKTIQPAGLTASGLSLLPEALWESSLPTFLPPSPPSRFYSRLSWASQRSKGPNSPASQDHPMIPGFTPQLPVPSTQHCHPSGQHLLLLGHLQEPLILLSSAVHDSEGSFPPSGFWKHAGQISIVSNEPGSVTGA